MVFREPKDRVSRNNTHGERAGGMRLPECQGVTVTLLNCEVLRVVVLPLATARPM